MAETINAVLDLIEARQHPDPIVGAKALEFLQAIYRSARVPLSVRMRAAIEARPCESPKLSATAILQGDGFAERLERAIARSGSRLIERQPNNYAPGCDVAEAAN